jgi:hypothetical protein
MPPHLEVERPAQQHLLGELRLVDSERIGAQVIRLTYVPA